MTIKIKRPSVKFLLIFLRKTAKTIKAIKIDGTARLRNEIFRFSERLGNIPLLKNVNAIVKNIKLRYIRANFFA